MKRLLLIFALFFAFALPKIWADDSNSSEHALYCADNKTLYFTYGTLYSAGDTYTADDGTTHTITAVYTNFNQGYSYISGVSHNYLAEDGTETVGTSAITTAPWAYYTAQATTTIDFQNSFQNFTPTNLSCWFGKSNNVTEVKGGSNLNTASVTNMSQTFYFCSKLTELDVSKWDTGSVTNMSSTFNSCSKLTELDVSNWDTGSVTNMSQTFLGCSGLTELDVSKWDTGSVTDMSSTFNYCSALTGLDVSKWDTGSVTNMSSTFYSCSNLTELDVSNWDTGSVTNMSQTFYFCSKLTELDVSNWDIGSVTSMSSTFSGCSGLTELDVSKWNTGSVTNMSSTFNNCSKLTELDVSGWNTGSVTNMSSTFWNCSKLTELDVSNWDTGSVNNMSSTFSGCSGLTELAVSNWDTGRVTNMSSTFNSCSKLTELDVSNWDTGSVNNMSSTFSGCSGLTELDVSNWNTARVTNMKFTFYNCSGLTSLTFGSGFNTESISYTSNVSSMFSNDNRLRYIDFYASTDVDAITSSNYSSMFSNIPATTVVYLPAGSSEVTSQQNVVYTDGTELKCPKYYSMDKVDIEFPRTFKTNTAEYTRTMSNTYGSVVLPYAFTSNDDIQAYTLQSEKSGAMYFVDEETVPAHTPFAFKKLGNADFTMTDESGNFGIIVNATRDTQDSPYTSDYTVDITGKSTTYTWGTKGYYVQQEVSDYSDAFYIASDKFYRADGTLTMYPHRVTFHGAWQLGNGSSSNSARFYEITTGEHEIATAIEAAEVRKTEREAAAIYDAQGRRHQQLQHGMNIIRMQDGTIRKVVK